MSEFLPFSRPSMGDAELAALREVLQSGWITTGPEKPGVGRGILYADRQPSRRGGEFGDWRHARHADGVGHWPGR